MDSKIIKDTFSIVKSLKNDEGKHSSDFDTQLNILFSVIAEELHHQNIETPQTIKKILEDKLLHLKIEDMKSFYLGKLSGISQIIGQIKNILDFEFFANELSDEEVTSLLVLYSRGESVSESTDSDLSNMLVESSSVLNHLESKDLIVSQQISCYNLHTLSYKGNQVINFLHKKDRKLLDDFSEPSYLIYENEEQQSIQGNFYSLRKNKMKNLFLNEGNYKVLDDDDEELYERL